MYLFKETSCIVAATVLHDHYVADSMRGDGLTIAIPFMAAALSLARGELCGVGKAPPRPYHGDSLVPFLVGGGAAEAAAAARGAAVHGDRRHAARAAAGEVSPGRRCHSTLLMAVVACHS